MTLGRALGPRAAGRRLLRRGGRDDFRLRVTGQQRTEPTIYFFALDSPAPGGGNKVIYRHVDVLNSAGLRALALHQRQGFRYSWFVSDTPVIHAAAVAIGPQDLLVVPEGHLDIVVRNRISPRHVVLNQGWSLTWSNDPGAAIGPLSNAEALQEHYRGGHRPLAVIATSDYNAAFVRFAFPELDVREVRLGIDPDRFFPSAVSPPPRIVYIPKHARAAEDAAMVIRMLQTRGTLAGWEISALTGHSEDEFAAELRNARIFLSVSSLEGLGLPPMEAMASGCYVVGYHAIGGREFMHSDFSSPVESDDVLALARALEDAIVLDSHAPGLLRERGMSAARFIRDQYSPAAERIAVLAAYSDLI